MNVLQRVVLPALNALLITTVLIYCMFLLIKSDSIELTEANVYRHLDWVHIPEDKAPEIVKSKIPKPEKVLDAPVITRALPTINKDFNDSVQIPVEEIIFDTPSISAYPQNQLTLVFAYPAKYPASKLARGIEGYASVGFSVSPVGEVFDAFVIDSEPKGAFERSALKAIEKFKYKPRYDNGIAVSTSGQSYIFRYEIDE